ncbi:MAG: GDP-mannose 4,6-dehydratase [SAR324 cluster bacterium]|nr:GDP-mannose 4,6-dehydratase [SAR324 cluster bacterium]
MVTASKKALICGISGQDGAYLAKLLLDKGYEVVGSSRDAEISLFGNLVKLGIRERVQVESATLTDFRSVLQIIKKIQPAEIYNLSGQSSVGLSFQQPVETLESIGTGTLNLLEAIRFLSEPIRLYNACSSECFGDTAEQAANEYTAFRPRSPYAVAKATAFWQVSNYREAYDLFACSGILTNHDSPLRPERFVTQKIVTTACRIASGSQEKLELGNIDIVRDWGWAPEYVEAMWLMLQQQQPDDFVIATGKSYSLQDFVCEAFKLVNLDWNDHVYFNPSLHRPSDLKTSRADPAKASKLLNWTASSDMVKIVKMMVQARLDSI